MADPVESQRADFFRHIERHGQRPALIDGNGITMYAQLAERADLFARQLPRQRSLIFLQTANSVACITAYLACLRAGHAVHLMGQPASDTDKARLAALEQAYQPQAVLRPYGDAMAVASPVTGAVTGPSLHPDLRVLLSTSGSTGSPKLVKLSETNLAANAASIRAYLELGPADRAMTSLKLHYSYGMSVLHSHLAAGGSLVLTDEPVTAAAFWHLFEQAGATSFAGVPYTFELLAGNDRWARMPGLRQVTQAGGRLAPDMVRKVSRLGMDNGWRFFVMYGQTEAAPRIAWLPPELAHDHPDCIGRAVPGGTLSIMDEAGMPVEIPEVDGQLVYSGPNVMMGYAASAADLASDCTPAHLLTGDIARRTAQGLFRITGRSARMVKPFGLRINLDEVQELARSRMPGAICAGTDDGIVVAVAADALSAQPEAAGAGEWLARAIGLPPQWVQVAVLPEIPQLANGKPDYRAVLKCRRSTQPPAHALAPLRVSRAMRLAAGMDTLRSPAFYRRTLLEAGGILGLVRPEWGDVRGIFAQMTGRPAPSGQDSFQSLAGDSLSFVQTSLALEDYLGQLPDDWDSLPIDQLEALRGGDALV